MWFQDIYHISARHDASFVVSRFNDSLRKVIFDNKNDNKNECITKMQEVKMVTIDNIIQNVGKFDGKVENHRMYERAKENILKLQEDKGMMRLEDNLKMNTGYNDFNLPREPHEYSISLGDVTFRVKSETTTKRPQYKTAVTQMENYLNGIMLLLSSDRVITGVAKEEGKWCISAETLLEQYELIIAGVKSPGIKQTIKYETCRLMAQENVPQEFHLSVDDNGNLTIDNFRNYVRKDRLMDVSMKYVKAYEKALGNGQKVEGIVPVNTRKGYKEENTKTEGTNWAYVTKTLVDDSFDDEMNMGELNILADPNISVNTKRAELPSYDLFVREPFGEKKLYVGIESVYHRIQDLKEDQVITANRTKYVPKEIV